MRSMRIWRIWALLATLAISSSAGVITFVHTGTGTGVIGTTSFTNVAFTITEVADTTNRDSFGDGFWIDNTSASISISGVGEFTFITGTRTFVSNGNQVVGFSHAGVFGSDLFDGPANAAFATWDMLSAIGPITGFGDLMQWSIAPVETSGGTLVFADGEAPLATFQATLGGTQVPEAGSWLLVILGFAAVGSLRRCQRS